MFHWQLLLLLLPVIPAIWTIFLFNDDGEMRFTRESIAANRRARRLLWGMLTPRQRWCYRWTHGVLIAHHRRGWWWIPPGTGTIHCYGSTGLLRGRLCLVPSYQSHRLPEVDIQIARMLFLMATPQISDLQAYYTESHVGGWPRWLVWWWGQGVPRAKAN